MKKLNIILSVAVFCFLINKFSFSQANSVELQDGNGVFISSHSGIEDAYNAIPATITQAYIIEILSAYTGANELFPIDLTLKSGHSAVNTITIRPDAGNTGEIISSSNTSGIINIIGADYIILDGRPGGTGTAPDLEVRNTAPSGGNSNTIALANGATHCVVQYINSYNATNSSTGPKNIEIGTSPSIPGGNSDNLVENCFVSGGRTGIGIDGGSGTTANPNFNNTISKCTIENFGFNAIWLLNMTANTTVEDCIINGTGTASNIANVAGINIQSTYDGYVFNIRRNKITNFVCTSIATSLAPRGIQTVTAPGTGSVLNIENNFIAMTANNNNAASTFGILTTGTAESYTANIFYNTILIGGTQTGGVAGRLVSAGIVKASTVAGVVYNQKNNICINNRTGGTPGVVHAGCAIDAVNGTLHIDYNCYLATGSSSAGTNSYAARWDSVGYDNLNSYAAVSGEQNSRFKNVTFVSSSDLHLNGASIQDPDLSARPISGIAYDIDGDPRNANFPYKGADESTAFNLSALNLTANLEACSPTPDTIIVSLRNVTSPYSLVEMTKSYLNAAGNANVNFAKAVNGVNYYLVVNHRNSIETWSKSGGEVFSGAVLNFNFTSAATQAFGNNMVLVGGKFSFYTGDVNQDGTVDLADDAIIDNDAFNFVTGYVNSDLNYDNIVDLTDASFADNNTYNFVSVIRP
jgi:hypothetical protein